MRLSPFPAPALTLPILVLVAVAGACTSSIDADQARVCRTAIPAMNAGAQSITIESTAPGHRPGALRIAYGVVDAGGTARNRAVTCLFASQGLDARKGVLTGLATEEGPLTDAAFYFLKRFYLDDLREPPLDPGPPPVAGLPEVSPGLAYGLQQFVVALPAAATYMLLASAYALIYGLVGRILLSFGEFAALGSVAGILGVAALFSLELSTPLAGILVALLFAVGSAALHGFAASRLAVGQLMNGTGQQVLIGSVGLALALSEYLRIAAGTDTRWLPPVFNEPWPVAKAGSFVVTMTPVGIGTALSGFAGAVGLVLYLRHSAFGHQWRALADDRRAAALCGVDETAVRDRSFIIACALSGGAGLIVTVLYGGLGFAGGFTLGLKALIAAILGGIGSVPGAMIGGLLIAGFEAVWSATLPIEHRDLAVFSLLCIILILRPGGIFGDAELAPRSV